jgi:FAD/FMN-containing dehydrogenase
MRQWRPPTSLGRNVDKQEPLMTMTADSSDLDLAQFAATLEGTLLRPGEARYDDEVATFNLATSHRAPIVVAATNTADVVAAVRFAAAHRLPVGVNASGHGAVTMIDQGVLVSTKNMTSVQIDPSNRTATIGAGVKWKAVIDAAAPYGLAPLCGSSSDVAAIGYTTGGGLPILGRTFGFAADHVQSMTVVTADGVVRTADPQHETELFWGIRGGKGNFGIVSEMTVDLMPVDRLYGGGIYYAGEHAPAVLRAFRAWAVTLDEKANPSLALLRLPPIPDIPEPLRGKFVVHVRFGYVGSTADGERLVAPMREAAPAIFDSLGEMPYTALDSICQDPDHPVPFYERSTLLRAFDEATVEHLLTVAGPAADIPVLSVEVRQLGGALGRSPAVPNAVGSRDAGYVLIGIGVLMPPIAEIAPAGVDRVVSSFAPFSTGRSMVNLHGRPTDADRGLPWAPDIYARLCALKAAYDPNNMFCFGHAIPATAQSAALVAPREEI